MDEDNLKRCHMRHIRHAPVAAHIDAHANRDTRSPHGFRARFGRFASCVTHWTGSPWAFGLAALLVVVWGACGPAFHYSETWQLVINTGTTIITFLMVFVIQQSQNKDSHALHLKLDGLISAIKAADDELIDIEKLDEAELDRMAQRYASLAHTRRDLRRKSGDPDREK
jgi:low affinity Fe/Cu permease